MTFATFRPSLVTATVNGEHEATRLAAKLVQSSKWFEMTPLPDDGWEFIAKDEDGLPSISLWQAVESEPGPRLPDGDYILAHGAAWFTVKGFSVRIKAEDEGVAVDIYPLHHESEDPISSAWAQDIDVEPVVNDEQTNEQETQNNAMSTLFNQTPDQTPNPAFTVIISGLPDLQGALRLIEQGRQVDISISKLQRAATVATAVSDGKTIGVGTIKTLRQEYAGAVAERAKTSFDSTTPELGYFAVDPAYRGQGVATAILAALIASRPASPFWCTTIDTKFDRALLNAGFQRNGSTWQGEYGVVTLWVRPATPEAHINA